MPKKKITLFYASVGSGHNMVVSALEEAFNSPPYKGKYDVESIDSLSFIDNFLAEASRSIYENLNEITGPIYDYFIHHQAIKSKTDDVKIGQNLAPLAKKFEKYVLSQKPNVSICVHPFPAVLLSYYKAKHRLDKLSHLVTVTDFCAHPFWYSPQVNLYSVHTQQAKKDLIKYGVPPEKIKVLGIPLREGFSKKQNKSTILKKYGLKTDLSIVLVQAGSLRSGVYMSVEKSLRELLTEFNNKSGFFLIIAVGSNEKLWKKINSIIAKKHLKNIKLIGFTNKMHELMAVANLLVTKAGGLICSEAITVKVPLLIAGRYCGEERTNTDFLMKNKAAVRLMPSENIYLKIKRLLKNKKLLSQMAKNAKRISKPNATQDIAKLVGKLLEG